MRIFTILLLLLSTPVFADQEFIAKYGPMLEKCYFAADEIESKTACKGVFADACMATEEGGQSTFGMSTCAHSEAEVWDRLLNLEYANATQWATTMDADEAELFPEYANRVKRLRNAQRAWIAFRDADCELAYAAWGAGSMRHIAGSNCLLAKTAERTIELWTITDMMQ